MRSVSLDHVSPPVGPNIVSAWFESALNPLLNGLENELNLLRKRTFTWRAHSRQMLAMVPVRSHVPYQAWANFDQFLSFYNDTAELCRAHDVAVAELAKACGRMYDSLISNDKFHQILSAACRSARLDFPPGQTVELFIRTHEPTVIAGWIAEHVVNGSPALGDHYTVAPLWNAFRDEVLGFREHHPARLIWDDVERIRQDLLEIVDQLLTTLYDTRNSLSLQFDVPPAPLKQIE